VYIETRIIKNSVLLCRTQRKPRHGHYVSTTKERKHREEEIFIQLGIVDEEIHLRNKEQILKMVQGSCVCGDYKYEFQGEPLFVVRTLHKTAINPTPPSFTAHDHRPSN
jgi:hypothetical protein